MSKQKAASMRRGAHRLLTSMENSRDQSTDSGSALHRQWKLLQLLSASPEMLTVKQIADIMGVSMKTVRRDIDVFRDVGIPLAYQTGAHGRKAYRIEPVGDESSVLFTFDELLAIYLARRFLAPLAGTLFWQAAQGAFRKIRLNVPPEALEYLENLAPLMHCTAVGASDYTRQSDLIDDLMVGIEDCDTVRLTYRKPQSDETEVYEIHPYAIVFHDHSLYLVGWSMKAKDIRHWKVDRILEARRTGDTFERPRGFDVQQHLASSFGIFRGGKTTKVVIHFDADVARQVSESAWHPSQVLDQKSDGSLTATFELGDLHEVTRWVLSFGSHAEVLRPKGLRNQVKQEIERMQGRYGE